MRRVVKDYYGPWGPKAVRIITKDISIEDFEDDKVFFVRPASAGTLMVRPMGNSDDDGDLPITIAAGDVGIWLTFGGDAVPCIAVRQHASITIHVGYPSTS